MTATTIITGVVTDFFSSTYDASFTVPADISGTVKIELWSAGGAGGQNAGGGGAGGCYSRKNAITVSPLDVIPWSFSFDGTRNNYDLTMSGMTVEGGGIGQDGPSGAGGSAGTASGGDVNTNGTSGSNGSATVGGNGGSAGNGGSGGTGGTLGNPGTNGDYPGGGAGGNGLGITDDFRYPGNFKIKITFDISGATYSQTIEFQEFLFVQEMGLTEINAKAWGNGGDGGVGNINGGIGGASGAYAASSAIDVSSEDFIILSFSSIINQAASVTLLYASGASGLNPGLAIDSIGDTVIDGNIGSSYSGTTGGAGGNAPGGGGTGGAGGTQGLDGDPGVAPGAGGGGGGAGDYTFTILEPFETFSANLPTGLSWSTAGGIGIYGSSTDHVTQGTYSWTDQPSGPTDGGISSTGNDLTGYDNIFVDVYVDATADTYAFLQIQAGKESQADNSPFGVTGAYTLGIALNALSGINSSQINLLTFFDSGSPQTWWDNLRASVNNADPGNSGAGGAAQITIIFGGGSSLKRISSLSGLGSGGPFFHNPLN